MTSRTCFCHPGGEGGGGGGGGVRNGYTVNKEILVNCNGNDFNVYSDIFFVNDDKWLLIFKELKFHGYPKEESSRTSHYSIIMEIFFHDFGKISENNEN